MIYFLFVIYILSYLRFTFRAFGHVLLLEAPLETNVTHVSSVKNRKSV